MRSEATTAAERDQVNPQAVRDAAAALWKQAGITNPIEEIDMRRDLRAVLVVRADVAGEPRLRRPRARAGSSPSPARPRSDGKLPVNCSGGVLSSNPIGASGMLRFGEAALQVRGAAGEHQVDGARKALGHAYGGGSQFFAMWVVGAEKPTQLTYPPSTIVDNRRVAGRRRWPAWTRVTHGGTCRPRSSISRPPSSATGSSAASSSPVRGSWRRTSAPGSASAVGRCARRSGY